MHAYRYFVVDLESGRATGTADMPDSLCTRSEGTTVIDAHGRLYYHNGHCGPITADAEDYDNG